MTERSVVIVGGGYAGTKAARDLDEIANVTLVDRKEVFFHRPAALRAAVDPAWTEKPFIGYEALLRRGRVLTAEVVAVADVERVVTLASGERVAYDALVLAVGSRYAEPAHFAGTTAHDAAKALRAHQEQIAAAEHVLIIGGGPAGVELAAEIAGAHPVTRVTLANAGDALLTGHPARLGRKVEKRLRSYGVELRLGVRLEPGADPGTWVDQHGDVLPQADLVYRTIGTQPDTGWLTAHPGWMDAHGRLRVDAHLRVAGIPSVFAAGDVTDVAEPKLAQYAMAQGREVAANVTAFLDGRPPATTHKPATSPMLSIPMGPSDGVTQLPLGLIAGGRLTTAMKARTLLVPYFRKALGHR